MKMTQSLYLIQGDENDLMFHVHFQEDHIKILHTIPVHKTSPLNHCLARISCDGNAPETVTPRSPQLESVGFIITIHIAIALDHRDFRLKEITKD